MLSWNGIPGYSKWHRRDRISDGGGIALCHKLGARIQIIEQEIPNNLEIIIFVFYDAVGNATLAFGVYRPPSQGTAVFEFIRENCDTLATKYKASNTVIIGDLNPTNVRSQFDNFLNMMDLENHVNFPTHISGSSLDLILSDMATDKIHCSPLGRVGSSDHEAIIARVEFRRPKPEKFIRTVWKWKQANWEGLNGFLNSIDWGQELNGSINEQVESLTSHILHAQGLYVPSEEFEQRTADQPWFGPRCREAASAKYKAWIKFKRHPSTLNKRRHQEATRNMNVIERNSQAQWQADIKRKLCNGNVSSKQWWGIIRDKQGTKQDSSIPPISKPNGDVALSSTDKATCFAKFFSDKMKVEDPYRTPPLLPCITGGRVTSVSITQEMVLKELVGLNHQKASGPDKISPLLLKKCASQIAKPLHSILQRCIDECEWPSMWKSSSIIPVHKKGNKALMRNYRPVALLPIMSKVFERLVYNTISEHLDEHRILCDRQHGFRRVRSAADLHLLLSSKWSKALDEGLLTLVLALDIEGAFDRVWHAGLVSKLESVGIAGDLLILLENYLSGRFLRVRINGSESEEFPVRAGVPQGSVLGPLLWLIFVNDGLNIFPEADAFADDVTLSTTCEPSKLSATILQFNQRLVLLSTWGLMWQVNFATHKTQFLIVWRSTVQASLIFGSSRISNSMAIDILGVCYDKSLTYRSHIASLAKRVAGKVASLRRIAWAVDATAMEALYKAQIRSVMEYSPLTWGGAAPTHLGILDKMQRRVERLINGDDRESNLQSLQHRRDVAGLTAIYKIQERDVPHLRPLKQAARPVPRVTRAAAADTTCRALREERCHTLHRQLQFLPRYSKMWNKLVYSVP